MNTEEILIKLSQTEGVRVTGENNGSTFSKHISIDALQDIFARNVGFNTGVLPVGCKLYKIVDGRIQLFIETEPEVKTCKYMEYDFELDDYVEEKYVVPTPRCLWCITFDQTEDRIRYIESSLWATKEPLTHANVDDLMLYRFPFSNVYDSGLVCFGTIPENVLSILTPSTARLLIDLFWSASFNDDLGGENFYTFNDSEGFEIYNALRLFKYLDGETEFPNDILYEFARLSTVVSRD